MNLPSRDEQVGRISGFLYGISALNGALREYEGSAYYIEARSEDLDIGEAINTFFKGQHEFQFSSCEKLGDGLGELEKRIARYILPDISIKAKPDIERLGRYLAFRLMDMIDDFFEQLPGTTDVFQLEDNDGANKSTFFVVVSSEHSLVMQFNKYDKSYHLT